jgi:hypothetical protein
LVGALLISSGGRIGRCHVALTSPSPPTRPHRALALNPPLDLDLDLDLDLCCALNLKD